MEKEYWGELSTSHIDYFAANGIGALGMSNVWPNHAHIQRPGYGTDPYEKPVRCTTSDQKCAEE